MTSESDLTFADLQEQVSDWADENFGDQSSANSLMGAQEELGELTEAYLEISDLPEFVTHILRLQVTVGRLNHSVLKRIQGIREDEEGVGEEAEQQAIAKIQDILDDIETTEFDKSLPPCTEEGNPNEELEDAIADTVIYCADLCHRVNIDMQVVVESAWQDTVSGREWNADVQIRREE